MSKVANQQVQNMPKHLGDFIHLESIYYIRSQIKYNWKQLKEKEGVKSLFWLIDLQHLRAYVCILLVSYFNLSFTLNMHIICIM